MKKINLDEIIEKELKVQFDYYVKELMESEGYETFDEVVEEIEYEGFQLLLDFTLGNCNYLDFSKVIVLWKKWLKEIES